MIGCIKLLLKIRLLIFKFCYGVFEILRDICRNLRFSLILAVNFYYVINKLIILVTDPQ
jgi:hypothetical protein